MDRETLSKAERDRSQQAGTTARVFGSWLPLGNKEPSILTGAQSDLGKSGHLHV